MGIGEAFRRVRFDFGGVHFGENYPGWHDANIHTYIYIHIMYMYVYIHTYIHV